MNKAAPTPIRLLTLIASHVSAAFLMAQTIPHPAKPNLNNQPGAIMPSIKITNWGDSDVTVTAGSKQPFTLDAGKADRFEIERDEKITVIGEGDDIAIELENESDEDLFAYRENSEFYEVLDRRESDTLDIESGVTVTISIYDPSTQSMQE